MLELLAGNWFAPATGSSSAGSIMVSVGKADGGRVNMNTPAALVVTNAPYGLSDVNIGANYQSANEPTTPSDHATSLAIPASYASLLDLAVGAHFIGNPHPIPTLETA